MLDDYFASKNGNGQAPLLNVTRAANGWIVTVNNFNRDKEVSAETEAKRKLEAEASLEAQKEREKQRMIREMKLQLANMSIIGEAAGKAQHKGIEEAMESWKSSEDDDEEDSDDYMDKIETMATKIVEETDRSAWSGLYPGAGLYMPTASIETHIFTDRQKMIEFVAGMLQPIIE